jgi:hypothetical protein
MWDDVSLNFLASAVIFWGGICPSILLPLAISPILSPVRGWCAPWLAALPLLGLLLIPEQWRSAEHISLPAFASLFGVVCLLVADRRPALSKSSRVGRAIAAVTLFFMFASPSLLGTFARIWANLLLGIGLSLVITTIVISGWRKHRLVLR